MHCTPIDPFSATVVQLLVAQSACIAPAHTCDFPPLARHRLLPVEMSSSLPSSSSSFACRSVPSLTAELTADCLTSVTTASVSSEDGQVESGRVMRPASVVVQLLRLSATSGANGRHTYHTA